MSAAGAAASAALAAPWGNPGADYQAALKTGEKYATFRRFAVEGQ
jgi:hypothetical protein